MMFCFVRGLMVKLNTNMLVRVKFYLCCRLITVKLIKVKLCKLELHSLETVVLDVK